MPSSGYEAQLKEFRLPELFSSGDSRVFSSHPCCALEELKSQPGAKPGPCRGLLLWNLLGWNNEHLLCFSILLRLRSPSQKALGPVPTHKFAQYSGLLVRAVVMGIIQSKLLLLIQICQSLTAMFISALQGKWLSTGYRRCSVNVIMQLSSACLLN